MNMVDLTTQNSSEWFCGLSERDRGCFMAILAHNLTVASRNYYEFQAPGVTDPQGLREINEVLHRVTSYLSHILNDDEDIGWAAVVTKRVLDPDNPEVANHTRLAWKQAERTIRRSN